MSNRRKVKHVYTAGQTMEGAGVLLKRVFGFGDVSIVDPFLLLDHFGSDNPDDYLAGFPWHPHRGIETVTYLHGGRVDHGDSLGNSGVIGHGDVQWMTAGSGIIHQEMPQLSEKPLSGFQLWVNLPRANKMMVPRYRDVQAGTIPEVRLDNGISVKVISGTFSGAHGPVSDIIVPIIYFDIALPAGESFNYAMQDGHTVLVYVYEGSALCGVSEIDSMQCAVLDTKGDVVLEASDREACRFLFMSGPPLREPVAWGGPIVMNTQQELDLAFEEYENGTFIKK